MPPHVAMPPSAIGKILLAGKLRSGTPWYKIEAQCDIRKATREFWMNGHVQQPPLIPVLCLAEALGIDGDEFMCAVLGGALPGWAALELREHFEE